MIFLTVGTQLPFPRLIHAVDTLAPTLDEEIFGQIGHGCPSPKNFASSATLPPIEFEKKFSAARLIISHAGIGTVLAARKHGKPIIIFPRRSGLGEHRNDHQLATCAQLQGRSGIYVANDDAELGALLQTPNLSAASMTPADIERRHKLTGAIMSFIDSNATASLKHKSGTF
ncbi:glucuronosyltransferase [Pseudomonas sp. ODNR1LW]|nr:glucuronosyltransferase [Pseudomonas sp. ODNR1LW]